MKRFQAPNNPFCRGSTAGDLTECHAGRIKNVLQFTVSSLRHHFVIPTEPNSGAHAAQAL
jgi:hypothetical protein